LDSRDAECLRQCNDQIGCPGMPSWNAAPDHCHAITASSSVLCRAERSTPADGVRKPVSAFAERVLSGPSGNRAPRTMSEASGLIVSAKPMRREHVPLGILYMVAATIVFAVSSAVSKWLVASYPIGEVLFTRTAIALLTCALFILPHIGLAVFRTQRLRHHVLRSVSQGCSQMFLLIAFSLMPLAGATAINFSSPLFATLASALLLKETVGLARWLALLVGFGGVLIVTEPGAGAFQVGALFALANAILYGSVTAGVRGMTTTESAQTLTLYQLALLTGLFALLLPLGWTSPTPVDAAWIVFNGVSNAVGQYWWTRALHLAPASAVAPFNYLSLIWASILGFAIWGDVPTVSLVIGSAVVVASGLFLLWRESNARQAKLPANE
jgi:drug/metabolite transporter (DMT)-like permease